ncbi:MAG TPA: hypothetical protein VME24_06275 [Alphaproteobacteria bacterium]|nr:hypothetical protein [Alphaproteobacteria bacterium]
MRTTILLMISCLLSARAQAQTSVNATNLATVAEGIKITSGLQYGMKESDADEYLKNHGITCDTSRTFDIYCQEMTNGYMSLSTSYPLKGKCCLDLYYWHADTTDTWDSAGKGWERDSLLTGAEIESNWLARSEPHGISYGQSWDDYFQGSNYMNGYISIRLKQSK